MQPSEELSAGRRDTSSLGRAPRQMAKSCESCPRFHQEPLAPKRTKLNENKYGKIAKIRQASHYKTSNGPIPPNIRIDLSFYRYLAAFKHVFRILILGGSETLIGHLCLTPYYSTNPECDVETIFMSFKAFDSTRY